MPSWPRCHVEPLFTMVLDIFMIGSNSNSTLWESSKPFQGFFKLLVCMHLHRHLWPWTTSSVCFHNAQMWCCSSHNQKGKTKTKNNYWQKYFWMLGVGCGKERWHCEHFLNQHLTIPLLKFFWGTLSQELCPVPLTLLFSLFLVSSHPNCLGNQKFFSSPL